MFTFIQSFFFNKDKSITPLQNIVVVSYNKTNYFPSINKLNYSSFNNTSFNNTQLNFNTKKITWPPK